MFASSNSIKKKNGRKLRVAHTERLLSENRKRFKVASRRTRLIRLLKKRN